MLCTNIVLGFTRGHSGLYAPLHSWLLSLSLNPWGEGMSMPNPCTSCGDSVWGTCVNSVCGLHTGYFLAILDVMGGELLHVAPLLAFAEASPGRKHLLVWTGLTWPQDIIPLKMFLLQYRHGAPLSMVLSAEAPHQVGSCGQWVLSESCQYIPCP